MNWSLSPAWSTRAIAAVAVILLVLAAWRWWRERRGGKLLVIRAGILVALLLVMLNPQTLLPFDRSGKPKLIVLLDTSSSMATRDADNDSRLSTGTKALNADATRRELEREFDVEIRRFDRSTLPTDFSQLATNAPLGDASDLASALMSAASELGDAKSQAGVLLISDGRATTGNTLDAAQLALARSVPLWTWCLGGPVQRHDLWIETVSSEALAFSGAEVELNATLRVAGYPNRSFNVEILRDGQTLETKEVLPDANGIGRLSVRVKAPDAGEQRFVFRVAPQPEEADASNNERAIFLRSVGEKVRVLLAEGQPHWDTKFLVQSLKRDSRVELTALYRVNAARNVALVSTTGSETRVEKDLFPRTAEAMNAFDIIVLGRGADAFFDSSTEALLTDFVSKRGGSLIFGRGKPYGGRFQPLAKFEPVAWGNGATSNVKLRPTDAGRDNPIFDLCVAGSLEDLLERLPALDQASATLGEKPLAVVLANSADPEGPVLLAYQRYGQGKALSLNASGLWRWSFREIGQDESEVAYRRFWVSLMQWLLGGGQFMPGADVALASSRRYYNSEQPMQFLVSTRNLDRAVYQPRLVIAGNGRELEVEPRARGEAFVAEAGPFAPGTYRVTLRNNVGKPAEISQSVEVVTASVEKQELSADPETMRKLAEISGGSVVDGKQISNLGDIVRRWQEAREIAHRQKPVWDRWWWMTGLLALLGAEWWLRRKEGLL